MAVLCLAAALRLYALDAAPPGLYYDEAANGIDALDLLTDRQLRIFFPGNQGREPLQIYLVALATLLVGPGWLAVRLPSVMAGLVAVAATCLLGAEIGGRRVGLLSGLLLATSYWHVSLSRLGFRAVWVPVVVALALALALRASRGSRGRGLLAAVAAGAVVGLGLYTYLAARVVPALLLIAPAVAIAGRRPRPVARRLVLLALLSLAAAAVVAAPLGLYFWRHPDLFWGRVETASGGPLGPLGRVAAAIGTFVWAGDPQARHNLPERPAFDPSAGGLFLLGLVLSVRGWRDPARAALPLAMVVMLLPQALATGEPHFLRAAGALVPACVIAAIGLDAVLERTSRPPARAAAILLLAALWSGLVTRDYFGEWARSRSAYEAFEGQGRDAAALLASLPPGEPVAVGSSIYAERPTYFLGRPDLPSFDSTHAIVVPTGATAAVVVPTAFDRAVAPRPWLGDPVAGAGTWPAPDGGPAAALYRVDPRALAPARALAATFGGVAALDGYDAALSVAPGGRQLVSTTWRVLGPAPAGLRQFAHAVVSGPGGERVIAAEDGDPFPSRQWRGGETVRSWYDLGLPADVPVGAYWIETGFYRAADLTRLPAADPSGRPAGDRVLLGPLKVWNPVMAAPAPTSPIARFDAGVVLASVEAPATARAGQPLALRMGWWASGPAPTDLTIFVHLLDGSRRERAGADAPPRGGSNPTTLWQPGESIGDERTLALPPDLPAGRYVLEVGLYDPSSGQRLRLLAAPDRLGDAAIVATVDVGS